MGKDDTPPEFTGTAYADLKSFPATVQGKVGVALRTAQEGETPPNAKPLQGFGGAGVLEIVVSHDTNAYRCVYTVRLVHAIYVLHCFEKKSTQGSKTSRRDIALIRQRLAGAERRDAAIAAAKARGGQIA